MADQECRPVITDMRLTSLTLATTTLIQSSTDTTDLERRRP
jgi:hypothetical protein